MKILFSVSVDVITLIVNDVKFLGVIIFIVLFESLLFSVIIFRSLLLLSHNNWVDWITSAIETEILGFVLPFYSLAFLPLLDFWGDLKEFSAS